jgi:hypothetical protein
MPDFKFKFQMYKHLQENIPNIYSEAKRAADEIGIPKDLRGKFGLTGAISRKSLDSVSKRKTT